MDELDSENIQEEINNLRSGIREIAHEINNPLGVLRMAAYLMETTNPDEAKRKHYIGLINASVDRIEQGLKQLRALRDNPSGPVPTPSQQP
ncbi:MAG: histidine kinase dimerization/phospho-acceptor domain-containing protein [bacterium]